MELDYLIELHDELREKGVEFTPGLSDSEIVQIQVIYGFEFPPDLRSFLQYALPTSPSFPNWRTASKGEILKKLNWPLEGIYFDIERNAFWLEEWGVKPTNLAEALEVAKERLVKVPILIPVYSHRYLPSEPTIAGNPVFSIYQTDIIYYGNDLASYFTNEFGVSSPGGTAISARPIRFWSLFTNPVSKL